MSTREQWQTTGMITSVLGALMIFGPWLNIRYYDSYGTIFESYNGLTLFDSGYFFGLAMFIPIAITVLFIVSIVKFKDPRNQKIGPTILVLFLTIFFLSWWYNYAVTGVYDNYPYYTETYESGFAETIAVGIAFLNIFFAYTIDRKSDEPNPPIQRDNQQIGIELTKEETHFCPNCGADIAAQTESGALYCPFCGKYLNLGK